MKAIAHVAKPYRESMHAPQGWTAHASSKQDVGGTKLIGPSRVEHA